MMIDKSGFIFANSNVNNRIKYYYLYLRKHSNFIFHNNIYSIFSNYYYTDIIYQFYPLTKKFSYAKLNKLMEKYNAKL